jgi:anthranilate phosphoribosyltransferase
MQNGDNVNTYEFDSVKLGLNRVSLDELQGGEPDENAEIIKSILNGEKGPKRDIVLLNAAAGIVVGGQAETLNDGLESAKKSVDSGVALNILNQLAG